MTDYSRLTKRERDQFKQDQFGPGGSTGKSTPKRRMRLADQVFLLSMLCCFVSCSGWLLSMISDWSSCSALLWPNDLDLLEEASRAIARGEFIEFEQYGWRHSVPDFDGGVGAIYVRSRKLAPMAFGFLIGMSFVTTLLMKSVLDSSELPGFGIVLAALGYGLVLSVSLMSQAKVEVRLASNRGVFVETQSLLHVLTESSPSPQAFGPLTGLQVSDFDDEYRLYVLTEEGKVRLLSHVTSPEGLGRFCAELAAVWETSCER